MNNANNAIRQREDRPFRLGISELRAQMVFKRDVLTSFIGNDNGAALVHIIRKYSINANDIVPGTGKTCFGLAIESGAKKVVEALIEEKADPNQPDIFGKTPLKYLLEQEDACLANETKSVSLKNSAQTTDFRLVNLCAIAGSLLKSGANLQVADERKNPLSLKGRKGPVSSFLQKCLAERSQMLLGRS